MGTFSGDQLTSIGTFFPAHTPKLPEVESSFRLRAMATDPNYRGQGMGQDLILGALEILREKGADRLWCDARKVAIGFYEKLGFSKIDEWYEVRNVGPHQLMYYEFKTIS
ncbi:MAG: GNAT family N-acetyltransferase [Flavobacteriales bacterium]|nr:GNAT family N-acetyltransferase [Flavobacteriales bacterium]